MFVLISTASAAVFFNQPYPWINIRDPTSGKTYLVQIISYARTGNTAVETDNGIDPYQQGSLSATDQDNGGYFSLNELNGEPLQTTATNFITEFTSNFDVQTPNGWISGTGYSIAVLMYPNAQGLENGLGNPLFGQSTYQSYNSLSGQAGTARLYGPSALAYPQTQYATIPGPNGGPTFYTFAPDQDMQQDSNIVVFSSDYPTTSPTLFVHPIGQPCPAIMPALLQQIGNYCVYSNRYISYIDLSFPLSSESTVTPRAATTGYGVSGVFEARPDISGTRIARETNLANPGTTNFDIMIYDVAQSTDIALVPELSAQQPLVQTSAAISGPYVAFIETPTYQPFIAGFLPVLSGNLHLYNLNTNTRTVIPIASNAQSPKIAYNTNTQQGVLAWNTQGQIQYVIFTQNSGALPSFSTTAQMLLPAQATSLDTSKLTIKSGSIYYVINTQAGALSQQIWRFDVNSGSNTPVLTRPNTGYAGTVLFVNNDESKISVRAVDTTTINQRTMIYNIGSCQNPPCSQYDLGSLTRTVGSNVYSMIDAVVTLPKENPSIYGARVDFYQLGRIDISNI